VPEGVGGVTIDPFEEVSVDVEHVRTEVWSSRDVRTE
jgi:hypothetical protein